MRVRMMLDDACTIDDFANVELELDALNKDFFIFFAQTGLRYLYTELCNILNTIYQGRRAITVDVQQILDTPEREIVWP